MGELLESQISNLGNRRQFQFQYHPPTTPFFLSLLPYSRRILNFNSGKLLKCTLSREISSNQGLSVDGYRKLSNTISSKGRVFLLDVNPLCYEGGTPSLQSFVNWISLLFSQVSFTDAVIAVLDGEDCNEYRRKLLPSYKANRRKSFQQFRVLKQFPRSVYRRSEELVKVILKRCNVPVVKIEGYEADDVVATIVDEVLQRGYRVAIASPDKDFKQLISENVQIVMPVSKLGRWSFYTLKHYVAQHNCDPESDLSLRCILGDEIDGVQGIQDLVPGFGRKTAMKLLKKHGSLDNLLKAAATRTVAKEYAQEALTKHADFLRRNYEVLSLKRDIDVRFEEQWLCGRDPQNDAVILSEFINDLGLKTFNSRDVKSEYDARLGA